MSVIKNILMNFNPQTLMKILCLHTEIGIDLPKIFVFTLNQNLLSYVKF